MNKKGFTLVELLAVIIILSLLTLLASTSITKLLKDSKDDLYETQMNAIKAAAESWGADNLLKLPKAGECKYLTLYDLKEYGLLDSNILDPRTNEPISDDLIIKITGTLSSYEKEVVNYEIVDEVSGCKNIYPKRTYEIGDYIKLPGRTNIMVDTVNSCNFQSTLNYTQWNVIDITGDSIKLYSYDGLTNDGNFLRLSSDSIGTAACYGMFASPNTTTWDISSYYYDSDGDGDGDYTISLPTIGDFTNIITVSGSNYSLKNDYSEWFNNFTSSVGGIALNDLGDSTNPYAYIPTSSLYFNLEGPRVLIFRPVITLSKSEIPDQSQFN